MLRQVFQSIKPIVDVLLLLIFVVAIFSVFGKGWGGEGRGIHVARVLVQVGLLHSVSMEYPTQRRGSTSFDMVNCTMAAIQIA